MVTDLRRLCELIPPGIRRAHVDGGKGGGIFMLDVLENKPISETRDVPRCRHIASASV